MPTLLQSVLTVLLPPITRLCQAVRALQSVIAGTGFVIYSNGRIKKNRKENVPGLEFIKLFKPVTYNYDILSLDIKLKGDAPASEKEAVSRESAEAGERAVAS